MTGKKIPPFLAPSNSYTQYVQLSTEHMKISPAVLEIHVNVKRSKNKLKVNKSETCSGLNNKRKKTMPKEFNKMLNLIDKQVLMFKRRFSWIKGKFSLIQRNLQLYIGCLFTHTFVRPYSSGGYATIITESRTFGVGKNSSPLSGSGMSSKCVVSSSLESSGTTGGIAVMIYSLIHKNLISMDTKYINPCYNKI